MSGPSAALLLDPKRFKKQTTTSNAPQQSNTRCRRPHADLSCPTESPRSRTPKDDVKRDSRDPFSPRQADASSFSRSDSKRNLAQLHAEGQSKLIEDMYGVERRENQPLKRVRVDIDKGATNAKDKFSGISKSALGDYMKENSEGSGATPAPPVVTNAIDLTTGKSRYDHRVELRDSALSFKQIVRTTM